MSGEMRPEESTTGAATVGFPVGIDLGTTYSVVAYVDSTGRPTTVTNRWGDPLTPSAVAVEDNTLIIGKEALKIAPLEPDAVADCFKRDMGRLLYHRGIVGQDIPPEVLSAFLRVVRRVFRNGGDWRRPVFRTSASMTGTRSRRGPR